MGKRTSYAPGAFSWVDLATTDAAAAKVFYSGVFGWDWADTDAGDGTVYTMCCVDEDVVCGLHEVSEDMLSAGVSPGWLNYVTVRSVDAAAARAMELGGDVITAAVDVADAGRMAVLQDPQEAAFAVWQPRRRIGAERVNDVGCLCMNELATPDVAAARSFYEGLFGWRMEVSDSASDGPHMVFNGEHINGAVFDAPERTSAHWRPCFTVASTQAVLERVRQLGGDQLLEPMDIGHGSIAMVRDPQGVLFTVFAGETDP
jgi:uncharacterized protein